MKPRSAFILFSFVFLVLLIVNPRPNIAPHTTTRSNNVRLQPDRFAR